MSNAGRTGEQNLTGIWNGLYTYPDGRSTSFVATLIEHGASLSGTTHEPDAGGGGPLHASVLGARHGKAITFTKVYEQADRNHRSPIVYEGALNSDATEIEGRWTIVRVWSGKFLMIRPVGHTATTSRKAFEPAR